MVFVYIKIYYAARERARRVINKPGFGKRISRRFAKNPTNTTISTTAAVATTNSSAGAKSGGGPPAASTKSNIVGQSCNNDTAASRNNQQHQIPTISTISNNNGVHQQQLIGINSSANNSTIGAEPEATAAVEACTVEASKSNSSSATVVKKRARFDLDPTNTTPSENENLLPPMLASTKHEAASGNVKIKKSVHILSATTASLTSTGRVSDPCEVTILDRPHAYGACAQNGGRQPKPPRTCRSIGVSTKDDQPVISNSITNSNSSSSNRGCVPPSNGTSDTTSVSSSVITQGLRSRLKMKFKSGGGSVSGSNSSTSCSRRRPSKETREVIDMGKVSGNNLVVCKKQNKFPLNGILRKKCASTTDEYNNSVANNTNTTGGCNSITNQQVSVGPNSTVGNSEGGGTTTIPNNNPAMTVVPKLTPEQEAEKQKKAMARKKERRATLILGLIMGSFIACWFPFFFLYSISPWCPICDGNNGPICVQGWGFTLAFWLGYSNSALNPVIYTVFNKDFRRAFKRILFK